MEHLVNIVKKELIELLRDPKLIAGLVLTLVMFPAMGSFFSFVASEQRETAQLIVVDLDGGDAAQRFLAYLSQNYTVKVYKSEPDYSTIKDYDGVIIIPGGFTKNLTSGGKASVVVEVPVSSISLSAVGKPGKVYRAISEASKMLTAYVWKIPKEYVGGYAVQPVGYTIFKGRKINVSPEMFVGFIASFASTVPMVLFIVVLSTVQIAVTSMALEKESKTLEMLLTQPIRRITILEAKLLGAVIVSVINALVFFVGMSIYMGQVMGFSESTAATATTMTEQGFNIAQIGLMPTPLSLLLLVVVIILSLVSFMSIAVVIGAAAEDVRSAQTLLGLLMPVIFVPAFGMMFTDLPDLPVAVQAMLLAIPFTHPVIATKAAFLNDLPMLTLSVAYLIAFSAISIYVATKLFASEKLLTFRFKWGKGEKRRKGLKGFLKR